MRTICIIPAFNEAGRIERVLAVATRCTMIDLVLVANNGSTDDTRERAECFGVEVIDCPERGKGNAITYVMAQRVASDDVVLLLDADLVGLCEEHIVALLAPVVHGGYVQAAGVCDTTFKRLHWRWHVGLSGERAFRASLLWEVCEIDYQGWALEAALNAICRWSLLRNKRQIAKVLMRGVRSIDKLDKYPTRRSAYIAKRAVFKEWLLGTARFILPVRFKPWLS
ncbi:glycosyltransferase [bacterium]|nr:glycosyltransferase [bacterium]